MTVNLEFLTLDEIETSIFTQFFDESVQEDVEALQNIEKQTMAYVKSKIRNRFDAEIIFSDAPYEGRELIIWAVSGIVVYRIIRRNAARKVPSDIRQDYEEIKEWLNGVKEGTENPDLPLINDESTQQVLYGNNKNEDLYL